jgi:short-subunit dehydrogenase
MSKKVILITGATAGIGRYTALHLAERGHHVIASGRREDALSSLADQARRSGHRIDTIALDVTDADSISACREQVDELTDGAGIDVLVNNAGYGLAAPLVEVSERDLRAQFETNVFGLMAVTRAFLPAMIARGSGRVLNVSSIGGRVTMPMMGAYHASKYAVEALSDAMRIELAPLGIQVVLIEPGPIRTEFLDRMNQTANAYRHEGAAYAEVFDRAERIEQRAMAMAPGPRPVARAMQRAIESRRPSARYVAPASNAIMLVVLNLMPTSLRDALMRAVFGLSEQSIKPAALVAAT